MPFAPKNPRKGAAAQHKKKDEMPPALKYEGREHPNPDVANARRIVKEAQETDTHEDLTQSKDPQNTQKEHPTPPGLPKDGPEDVTKEYKSDDGKYYSWVVFGEYWQYLENHPGNNPTPAGETPNEYELKYYKGRIGQGYWSVPNNWRFKKDPEFRELMKSIRESAESVAENAQNQGLKLSDDPKFYDIEWGKPKENIGVGYGYELTMFYETSESEQIPVRILLSELKFKGGERTLKALNLKEINKNPTNCYALALGFTGAVKDFAAFYKIATDQGYKITTDASPKVGDIWISGDGDHVMEIIEIVDGEAVYRSTNYGRETITGTLEKINQTQFNSNLQTEGSQLMRKT